MQDKSTAQRLEDAHKKIEHCSFIINGLENHEPFKKLIEDFKVWQKFLDDSWHGIQDEKKLREAQMTKVATVSLINALDNYKFDLAKAQEEIVKLENPDKLVTKDWDNK
jgi:hypothetical protein